MAKLTIMKFATLKASVSCVQLYTLTARNMECSNFLCKVQFQEIGSLPALEVVSWSCLIRHELY